MKIVESMAIMKVRDFDPLTLQSLIATISRMTITTDRSTAARAGATLMISGPITPRRNTRVDTPRTTLAPLIITTMLSTTDL